MLKAARPQPFKKIRNGLSALRGPCSRQPPFSCVANLFSIIKSGHSNLWHPSSYFPGEILAVLGPVCPCLPVARATACPGRRERVARRPLLCCRQGREWRGSHPATMHGLQLLLGTAEMLLLGLPHIDSFWANIAMVTCAKLKDCVCEQKWCILGPGTKGLVPNNRKFIFNWAKAIQGKIRKLRGSIKTLCKDFPKSRYLNSTEKRTLSI